MNNRIWILTLLATSISGVAHADEATIRQSLNKLGVHGAEILPSPVAGMKTVLTDGETLYVTEDGKHILQGPVYDVSGPRPVNVTNALLMTKLKALEPQMIVYKAAKEQYVITVFTDITCGYCHKLHEQIKDYNALGITVRYLAFPRQGLRSEAEQNMQAIWCSKDPQKAFDLAMKGGSGTAPASCNIDIKKHYALGVLFGVQGTPAMVLTDGTLIPGYQSPKELKTFLDNHRAQAK